VTKNLWTPWRRAYVGATSQPASACVFCEAFARREEERSLVVHAGPRTFILMNLYPYNSGHLLIAPQEHLGSLQAIPADALSELMHQARLAEKVLGQRYRPQGFNLGMNLGRVSGAGVLDHVHLHVVPRWEGDTNFMSVLAEVRVIPEDLGQAARELKELFRTTV